jgi:hypothetical protein
LCCGHKNLTAVVVDVVKFENYGKQEFLSFWTYICSLPHITKNLYELFKGELSHIVHRNVKQALKSTIWEKKYCKIMMKWFNVLPDNDGQNDGIANQPLCDFSILDDTEAHACLELGGHCLLLQNVYRMEFQNSNYSC